MHTAGYSIASYEPCNLDPTLKTSPAKSELCIFFNLYLSMEVDWNVITLVRVRLLLASDMMSVGKV
jgi:hypothetical protein